MLLQKLSSLLGIRKHQNPASEKPPDNTGYWHLCLKMNYLNLIIA